MLKEIPDENWDMGKIVFELENRRFGEPTIAYAESHDQALVGDKTIAFRLMDKDVCISSGRVTVSTPPRLLQRCMWPDAPCERIC